MSEDQYVQKHTLNKAAIVGLYSGAGGLILSSIQNTLGSHNHGAMGVITRSGGTIGLFAAMGATFAFTESYVANTRQTDDALNSASGACAAGFLAGIRARSIPVAVGGCVFLGSLVGLYDSSGGMFPSNDRKEISQTDRAGFFKKPRIITSEASEE